jgi:putative OPT family oligopeptide transporter
MSNQPFRPYVAEKTTLREFSIAAVLLGLVMTVILGAANAYLGLRAGMTIAATYPAAIIGMAVLKLLKGTILEENIARTVGSIGESIAAGAIFTIPAFVISGSWQNFGSVEAYVRSSALMIVGGLLGIFFVTLLRRVMVNDPDLPFPESVAAAEIHKAGQTGGGAAKNLFVAMGAGAVVYLLGALKVFSASKEFIINVGEIGKSVIRLGIAKTAPTLKAGGVATFSGPAVSPAYLGVGYIIGPELGALNFAGGLLAWGLFVPLFMYTLGPEFIANHAPHDASGVAQPLDWSAQAVLVWKFIVRPIAVGGMLVGAANTLFKMRKSLATGIKRSISDLKKTAAGPSGSPGDGDEQTGRLDRDINIKLVGLGLVMVVLAMVAVYFWFSGNIVASVVAAVVMAITGFFFGAVSGNLVGTIGSSNNPISGLTLSTLIIAALLMVVIGVSGPTGVVAVLGVASVVCVSSAVAGEMLQDLKVGHLLGGTPWKMQVGDILGVIVAGGAMFFPLYILHSANIAEGGTGFGDKALPAPQAGLMAGLAQGIVGGEMAWPLVVVGIIMGLSLVMVKVKSPMLVSVGMYLPLETTFAIFVGGIVRWITDQVAKKRQLNEAQRARTENAGVLVASGLIAGEALMGLVVAGYVFFKKGGLPPLDWAGSDWLAILVLIGLGAFLVLKPLGSAGRPDEPPPPQAVA